MRYLGLLAIGAALLTTGCAADTPTKDHLDAASAAINARQFDQAVAHADAALQKHPSGPIAAEALYLRGRALEQQHAASPQSAASHLQQARVAYIDALKNDPPPKLEAFIRTSLANVAYFQEDYTTAAEQWAAAYDRLEDPDTRAWTLYRLGLCRQRLGQFSEADQLFATVQQEYPNSIPAQRARDKHGVRGFSVQLATFANPASADAAVNQLRREGVLAMRQNASGGSAVLVGPMSTYQQAAAVKARFAGRYPDALIVP